MRAFRFRLDPVMRLKRYSITEKESEIQEIQKQIQERLERIDSMQQSVQAMRDQMLESEASDEIAREVTMDSFRAYTTTTVAEIHTEIQELEKQSAEKQKELVTLYQEEKILERLREKRQDEWNTLARKEETAMMDEIGGQRYNQRKREAGGVMLYLLLPVVLLGAAGGIGWYMGMIDESILDRIPIPGLQSTRSATAPVEIPSITDSYRPYTFEELLADPERPIPEIFKNLMEERERNNQMMEELREREEEINRRQALLATKDEQFSGIVQTASDYIQRIEALEAELEQNRQSEQTQNEEDLSQTIATMGAKESAPVIIELFRAATIIDPEEQREQQLRVIRLFRRMPVRARAELFEVMQKNDPQITAQIWNDFMRLDSRELYNIKTDEVDQGTTDPLGNAAANPPANGQQPGAG